MQLWGCIKVGKKRIKLIGAEQRITSYLLTTKGSCSQWKGKQRSIIFQSEKTPPGWKIQLIPASILPLICSLPAFTWGTGGSSEFGCGRGRPRGKKIHVSLYTFVKFSKRHDLFLLLLGCRFQDKPLFYILSTDEGFNLLSWIAQTEMQTSIKNIYFTLCRYGDCEAIYLIKWQVFLNNHVKQWNSLHMILEINLHQSENRN